MSPLGETSKMKAGKAISTNVLLDIQTHTRRRSVEITESSAAARQQMHFGCEEN